ncbi:MAG: O-methyltransferase [Planctomycetes bacterium]|nr:O-methyltransferase [Planctomycetota bacterium]
MDPKPRSRRWNGTVPLVALATAAFAALGALTAGPGEAPASAETKALAVLDDLDKNHRQGMMNVSPSDGAFLRILAASTKARRVLEIGASNGYSGIWIASGLRENGGKLTTLEVDAKRASLARENFRRAGVDDTIELIEADALKKVPELEGPFDMVFIDAWKQDYVRYLEMVYPKVPPGGIIAAHNVVSHANDMKDFLEKLKTYPDLETVTALEKGAGLSVSYKKKPWPKP